MPNRIDDAPRSDVFIDHASTDTVGGPPGPKATAQAKSRSGDSSQGNRAEPWSPDSAGSSSSAPAAAGDGPTLSAAELQAQGALGLAGKKQDTARRAEPDPELALSPRERAEAAQTRIDGALAVCGDVLTGWVTEADAGAALKALAVLRPEEQHRALLTLESQGLLETMVDTLSPQGLAELSIHLQRSGAFVFAPASDEKGRPLSPGPELIQVHARLPPCLQEVARDINAGIVKHSGAGKVYEPGGGPRVNADRASSLVWKDALPRLLGQAEGFVHRFAATLDIDKAVGHLRPGDSYRLDVRSDVNLGLGITAQDSGASVSAGMARKLGIDVKMSEKDDSYTVGIDAALLSTLSSEAGLSAVLKASTGHEAGDASRFEFHFDSPEQAAEAAKLLALLATAPGAGVTAAVLQPEVAKRVFAALSAVELGPLASAKLGVELSSGDVPVGLKRSAGGEAKGSYAASTRLELHHGAVVGLTVKREVEVELSVSDAKSAVIGPVSLKAEASGSVAVKAEVEQHVDIKPGQSLIERAADLLVAPSTITVGITRKHSGVVSGNSEGVDFKVTGDARALMTGVANLARGNVEGLAALMAVDEAEVTTRSETSTGLTVKLGAKGGGNSVSLKVSSKLKSKAKREVVKGSGKDAAVALLASLTQAKPRGSATPVQIPTLRPPR